MTVYLLECLFLGGFNSSRAMPAFHPLTVEFYAEKAAVLTGAPRGKSLAKPWSKAQGHIL